MRQRAIRILPTVLLLFLFAVPSASCATVLGTALSPVTGGVDMARRYVYGNNWAATPLYFLGGMIAGPFIAIFNGASYDAGVFTDFRGYCADFDRIFRPIEMINSR